MLKKALIVFMLMTFVAHFILPSSALKASVMIEPVMLRALKIFPDQPLVFDFIVDDGQSTINKEELTNEIQTIAKFFLTTLTIPEKELWVNLSVYEKDRMLSEEFSQTLMGQKLLEQDYYLKQISASLTDPSTPLGKLYWEKIHQKANELSISVDDVAMEGLNKIWIVPGSATVYEKDNMAVLGNTYLKVMTEKDYVAMKFHQEENLAITQDISSEVIKEVLLPAIEKEVNTSATFAPLRQIFSAMVLAVWYKELLRKSLLEEVYADQRKVAGIDHDDALMKERLFEQYLTSFKKGVYHFIKEEQDPQTGEIIPRKYFSGGFDPQISASIQRKPLTEQTSISSVGTLHQATIVNVSVTKDDTSTQDDSLKGLTNASQITSDNPDDFKSILNIFTLNYLKGLYGKYRKSLTEKTKELIRMFDNFRPASFMDSKDILEKLGLIDYKEIVKDPENLRSASDVIALFNPMNGGLGTSVKRKTFLKTVFQRKDLGAKATDLYYPLEIQGFDEQGQPKQTTENISIAELHLLQVLAQDSSYQKQIFESFVNDESLKPLEEFLNTIYLFDRVDERPNTPKRTYRQIFQETKSSKISEEMLLQEVLPVIDIETGLLTNEFLAPGGHGHFAPWIFQMISTAQHVPEQQIRVLFNGDGINNMIDPNVLGWTYKNKIPVVMVTTTRTSLDIKGGIIGVLRNKAGQFLASILELAQAKAVGQEKDFLSAGITTGNIGQQPFNTNTVLINDGLLKPFLTELHAILGEEKFLEFMTPDLITNKKTKETATGKKKDVFQLEGALGSALLNLNTFLITTDIPEVKALMKKFNIDRLVYFVNYDEEDRIKSFSPVKYAWDHWLYAYSGNFKVDMKTWRISSQFGSNLPAFTSMDEYYEDISNMISSFNGVDVSHLKEITIKGVVDLPHVILEGKVIIENRSGSKIDLNEFAWLLEQRSGRVVLKDAHLIIDENKKFTLALLEPSLNKADKKDPAYGGIDFEKVLDNVTIEKKSNQEIKIHVSLQDVLNIKYGDFDGLSPIVVQVVPFTESMFLGSINLKKN